MHVGTWYASRLCDSPSNTRIHPPPRPPPVPTYVLLLPVRRLNLGHLLRVLAHDLLKHMLLRRAEGLRDSQGAAGEAGVLGRDRAAAAVIRLARLVTDHVTVGARRLCS
eukprot:COSAG03_NODE_16811_length_391_cov_4.092466_1_plen_109_part_00